MATSSTQSRASVVATSRAAASPTYRQLTSDKLVNALLTLDDVPAGYTADKPERTDPNKNFCGYTQPNKENGYAAITFQRSSTSLIGHTVRQYDSVADASAQQDALAKAVRAGCSMTDNGTKLKVAQMSAPKLGDRTIGVELTSQGATVDEVFVQVGPVVLAVADAGVVGSADVTQMTAMAKKAIAKYKSAAAQS
ncbi:hypothetical protein [Flexivirga alba]|uniref:PknH-like extracellular domain-containing protein n=1 Tax=Flexivirga alba TaxID=702742 RepID=A0ABW2ACY0_9MICO